MKATCELTTFFPAPTTCPTCTARIEAGTNFHRCCLHVENALVCIECGSLSIGDAQGHLRAPTPEELAALGEDVLDEIHWLREGLARWHSEDR